MSFRMRLFSLAVLGWMKARFGRALKTEGRSYLALGRLWIHDGGRAKLGRSNVFVRDYDVDVKGGTLEIGERNYFNKNLKIVCFDRVTIGSDCLIADSVHFYDHDHRADDPDRLIREQGYVTRPIEVGNNVWICAKATILKGSKIGDGAIVAAGSVVTGVVPPMAVVGGIPARVLKIRDGGPLPAAAELYDEEAV